MTPRRRLLLRIAALLPVIPLGLAGAMYWRLSNPAERHDPLPASLIALTSDEGQRLLRDASATRDLMPLQGTFQTQEKGSWCGVASSATVLSAIRGQRLAQDDFFTDETAGIRSWTRITFGGMTLDALGALLAAHGAVAEVHHADEGLDAFRAQAIANLGQPGDYLIVNYHRGALDQGSSGHISPVGAYDAASDKFLVLDVASYAWPPVWVDSEELFAAMDTVDPEVDAKRGWVHVRGR